MKFFGFSSSTDQLVKKLKESGIFAPDFPQRKDLTHAEWAVATELQQNELSKPKLAAIQKAKNFREIEAVVKELADPKHASAVPVLSQLWKSCALEPVRVAVGHSLRRIGTADARAALIDQIEVSDHFSLYMGVRALFDENPSTAFERCAVYFSSERLLQPGGVVIPNEILRTFGPVAFSAKGPEWSDPRAPGWLREDRRWLDLCVSLRKSQQLGDIARHVLRYADTEGVEDALKEALKRETPYLINVSTAASGDLLARYQKGQLEEVWKELRAHDAVGGDLLEEARAVANETMKRVAYNADLLAQRLKARGWIALHGSLRTVPQAEDAPVIEQIEEFTGAMLPVSFRSFWETVGGINFVWDYDCEEELPELGDDLVMEDPLYIESPKNMEWQLEEWEDARSDLHPELWGPVSLDLAPDYLHKANISGGAAYAILLPFRGVDPIFANEEHNLPFVDYLRLCFKWGGFPRLERYPDRTPATRKFLDEMTEGLQPF